MSLSHPARRPIVDSWKDVARSITANGSPCGPTVLRKLAEDVAARPALYPEARDERDEILLAASELEEEMQGTPAEGSEEDVAAHHET